MQQNRSDKQSNNEYDPSIAWEKQIDYQNPNDKHHQFHIMRAKPLKRINTIQSLKYTVYLVLTPRLCKADAKISLK